MKRRCTTSSRSRRSVRRSSSAPLRSSSGRAAGAQPLSGEPLAAELRGDDEIARVGVERLGDQPVGDVRAVVPGGVDEVDAELDRAAEDGARALRIVGLAPDVLAGQAHGAEAEALHFEIAEPNGGVHEGEKSSSPVSNSGRLQRRRIRRLNMKFLFLYRSSPRSPQSTVSRRDAGRLREVEVLDGEVPKRDPRAAAGALGSEPGGAAAVCKGGSVTDGPYAEGKEIVGGWSFIETERSRTRSRSRKRSRCSRASRSERSRRSDMTASAPDLPEHWFRREVGRLVSILTRRFGVHRVSSARTRRRPRSSRRRNRGRRSCPTIPARGSIASRTTTCSTSFVARSATRAISPKSRSTTRSKRSKTTSFAFSSCAPIPRSPPSHSSSSR